MKRKILVTMAAIVFVLAAWDTAHTNYSYTSLDYPGATSTWGNGINNAGTIVGIYETASGVYGFSLSGGTYTSLNYPGATDTRAYGINDWGTIVGGYYDKSGEHIFLATPVPIPSSILLLGSGLIGLIGFRRKFRN